MKQLTDQDETEILDLFLGMYYFQFLAAAVDLDLFTLLSRSPGLTREEVADHLELDVQPARTLLLGCGAIGLLRKEGDRYFNTSGAERFFSKTHPANMVPAVRMANHIQFRPRRALRRPSDPTPMSACRRSRDPLRTSICVWRRIPRSSRFSTR